MEIMFHVKMLYDEKIKLNKCPRCFYLLCPKYKHNNIGVKDNDCGSCIHRK